MRAIWMYCICSILHNLSQHSLGKKEKSIVYATSSCGSTTEYVEDADVTFQWQELASGETQNFWKRKLPLVPVLTAMEAEGICLDTLF